MAENTRRDFIKRGALGTAAMLVYPPSRVLGANDRVRVGMIGVGGRGQELLKQVLKVPNAQLVAIADIYDIYAWIMTALDLPERSAAYMSGGVFSEKDGRQVPDTIVATLEYPADTVVTWQSTFSNSHYGLGERLLGSDGTIEHISRATDMVTGKSAEGIRSY